MSGRSTATFVAITLWGIAIAANSATAEDLYLQARLAAIDGDHAKCARLADKARKTDGATWHFHHVYASCTALNAQTKKKELGPKGYEAEVMKAITVLENLVAGPLIPMDHHRDKVRFMAMEMRKQLATDIAQMTADQN